MQSHDDKDYLERQSFMTELERRAKDMKTKKLSEITAGKEDELELASWKAHGMHVVVRPNDPQGILRISVGGGLKTPVQLDYCTIRGEVGNCIELLEHAILALKACPE